MNWFATLIIIYGVIDIHKCDILISADICYQEYDMQLCIGTAGLLCLVLSLAWGLSLLSLINDCSYHYNYPSEVITFPQFLYNYILITMKFKNNSSVLVYKHNTNNNKSTDFIAINNYQHI